MVSTWLAYNELAWTDALLADPARYECEVAVYADLIDRAATVPPLTMLHLGCGAGGHDRFFKRRYAVTGVDLSVGMLEMARDANPDVEYLHDDMRSVDLGRQFDIVAIPDSIDYMVTLDDLGQAIKTAVAHLKTGGILLVVANVEERFHDNNFAYTAEKNGVHVTLLENDYASRLRPNTYEATLVYLIRRNGQLSIHTDQHILGLFPERAWQHVLDDAKVAIQQTTLSHTYDKHVLDDGEHQPTVFVGRRL